MELALIFRVIEQWKDILIDVLMKDGGVFEKCNRLFHEVQPSFGATARFSFLI